MEVLGWVRVGYLYTVILGSLAMWGSIYFIFISFSMKVSRMVIELRLLLWKGYRE